MTATTQSIRSDRKCGEIVSYKIAAQTLIPQGVLVCVNSNGYAVNASDSANLRFVGVSYESCDNTQGASGDKSVRVWKCGSFVFCDTSAVQGDCGAAFYVSDNQTVNERADDKLDIVRILLRKHIRHKNAHTH